MMEKIYAQREALHAEKKKRAASNDSTIERLLSLARRLEGDRCEKFPHLICTENPSLKIDDLCEPCQARVVMQKWRESNTAQPEN